MFGVELYATMMRKLKPNGEGLSKFMESLIPREKYHNQYSLLLIPLPLGTIVQSKRRKASYRVVRH